MTNHTSADIRYMILFEIKHQKDNDHKIQKQILIMKDYNIMDHQMELIREGTRRYVFAFSARIAN